AKKAPAKAKPRSKKKTKRHAALPASAQPDTFGSLFVSSAYAETTASTKGADKPSKTTLLFSVGNARIVHGKLTYVDRSVSPAQKYLLSDLNLRIQNISMVGDKSTFTLTTPIAALDKTYQFSLNGSYRFLMASSMVKDLNMEGMVNDSHSFKLS